MKNKVLQTIMKHNLIEKGMHIVVGLSGGPDSVCLFDILGTLAHDWDLKLYAVHINHKLRPGAAENDQAYVEVLCKKNDVSCFVFTRDCNALAKEKGLTSEEAGRVVRYESFSEVAKKINESGIPKDKIAIALAHNANDQAETILFRIMRGTGTDGLAGIPYKRFDENGFAIVRPILDLKREEIEKYCNIRELHPRIDHTNNENIYARNRIRNMLIPFIEENFNENIIETINRLGQIASGDKEYIGDEALLAYSRALIEENKSKREGVDDVINIVLSNNVLSSLHNAIRFRVYTITLGKIGMGQNITFAQGELIDKVVMSNSPSAMCDLTDGYVVLREYDRLVFRHNQTNYDTQDQYRFTTMTKAEFDKFRQAQAGLQAEKQTQAGLQTERQAQEELLTYGAFQGVDLKDLCIRTRKPGDTINTGNGTKKIQDFFVDQKVPKHMRDHIKLLAKGSKILWVLPSEDFPSESMKKKGRFSADFKVENQNELVLVLEILCTL